MIILLYNTGSSSFSVFMVHVGLYLLSLPKVEHKIQAQACECTKPPLQLQRLDPGGIWPNQTQATTWSKVRDFPASPRALKEKRHKMWDRCSHLLLPEGITKKGIIMKEKHQAKVSENVHMNLWTKPCPNQSRPEPCRQKTWVRARVSSWDGAKRIGAGQAPRMGLTQAHLITDRRGKGSKGGRWHLGTHISKSAWEPGFQDLETG